MAICTREVLIELPHRQLLTIQPLGTVSVQCSCGTVWITQARSDEDTLIDKDSGIFCLRTGLVVLQALRPARLLLIVADYS